MGLSLELNYFASNFYFVFFNWNFFARCFDCSVHCPFQAGATRDFHVCYSNAGNVVKLKNFPEFLCVGSSILKLGTAANQRLALQEAGMEVYVPTAAELEMFKQATQQPVIDWLKTKIDPKLIQEMLQVVKDTVAQQTRDLK